MANRSDFNTATLPRYLKRILALQSFDNAHERGEAVRAWVAVHAHHRRVRNARLASRENVAKTEDTE